MIHPRIDQLLDEVDSRYALVIVAAKRARQMAQAVIDKYRRSAA